MTPQRMQAFVPVVRGALWATGLFCVVMAALLIATFVQTRVHASIDNPALVQLTEALERDPANHLLRDQVRALDLLARKAYFTTRWQLQWGAALLIGAGLLFFALHEGLRWAVSKNPSPPDSSAYSWWTHQSLSRRALVSVGSLLVLTGVISGMVVRGELSRSTRSGQPVSTISDQEFRSNWPGFRGPDGNGVAYVDHAPTSWDGGALQGVKWKVKVPRPGKSSPVVWKDRIFLTGADTEQREVYCFSRTNGRLLWRHRVELASRPLPKVDQETGYAAPTVGCDGARVFAIFATGELVCTDLRGRRIWSRDLGVPVNHYGHSSSLIAADGLLFVQFDHQEDGKLLALDGRTGNTRWEVVRPELSWASPIHVRTGSKKELIVVDNKTVSSYDPSSGTLFWSRECMGGEVGPSPAYAEGHVFVANEYAVGAAIRLDEDSSRIVWQTHDNLPSTASPVATERFVFFACAMGAMTCLDARTGEIVWTEDFDKGFYASPIIAAGRVYALDKRGIMRIFEVAEEYRPVSSPPLDEPAVATPAFLDRQIFIRGEEHLFCIEGP